VGAGVNEYGECGDSGGALAAAVVEQEMEPRKLRLVFMDSNWSRRTGNLCRASGFSFQSLVSILVATMV